MIGIVVSPRTREALVQNIIPLVIVPAWENRNRTEAEAEARILAKDILVRICIQIEGSKRLTKPGVVEV